MAISGTPSHPLLVAVASMHAALDEVTAAGVDPMYCSTPDKKSLLVELTRLSARVTALRAEVLAVAEDVAVQTADRTAGTWLATQTRTEVRDLIAAERLGARLRTRWPSLGQAARAGQVSWEQAGIICHALDQLPTDTSSQDPDLVTKAEAHLITEAGHFAPRALRRLARKVFEVIAPEVADAHEHRLLLDEEDRARAATRLSWRPHCDGTTDLHARLPNPLANRLRTYLDAYTSPRRLNHDTDTVDRLPLPRRRGEAFCALMEHLPTHGLPRSGGTATQILVTIDHHTLTSDLVAIAHTTTGDDLTAGQARRLACTAGIIPVVLGGRSQILDQGRSRRLFTGPIRTALDARDQHCRATDCDIPAAWCEAHHQQPWTQGGPTTLTNGILLCPHHHHRTHDPRYTTTHHPNGDIQLHRRT